ncbi:apical endosomal glycoprotein [Callorhinchus milii]|uniref:apical endosomal glycoprotein n=1 Tax=Callorhinchus milii TaxID=7868 RepID=UPI001C3F6C98|nr:apical endosomal glycoprotein [Callorhinchus milii]
MGVTARLMLLLLASQSLDAISCNFEVLDCDWKNDTMWIRDNGKNPNLAKIGPMYDHTIGTGHYIVASQNSSAALKARVITIDQVATVADQCLSFYYHMYGPRVGTLNLIVQQLGSAEVLLWTRTGTHGNHWRPGFHTIPPQAQSFQLMFEASSKDGAGHIALDDITVVTGSCKPQRFCTFETNTCGFTANNLPNWERQNAAGGSIASKPPADHTSETAEGYYMMAVTGDYNVPNGFKKLLTSSLQEPTPLGTCLHFWFYMNGKNPGTLNVYFEENNQKRYRIWSESVGQGDVWQLGTANIKTAYNWKVLFEAVGAGSEDSYIALDDVRFSEKACPTPGVCDFEQNICSWRNKLDPGLDQVDWNHRKSDSHSIYKGPNEDHTLGTREGHYMFLDFSAINREEKALLMSEHFPPTEGSCFIFSYYVDTVSLTDSMLKVTYYPGTTNVIWSAANSRGNRWVTVRATVESPVNFQIVFHATKSDFEGFVAIDDLEYYPGITCDGVWTNNAHGHNHMVGVGTTAAILIIVLIAVMIGTIYWLRKRGASLLATSPRTSTDTGSATGSGPCGFDNVIYENQSKERVIVGTLPSIEQTAP